MTRQLTAMPPRPAVLSDLREGLGVEDISVNRKIPLATVRKIVDDLGDDEILANQQWHQRESV